MNAGMAAWEVLLGPTEHRRRSRFARVSAVRTRVAAIRRRIAIRTHLAVVRGRGAQPCVVMSIRAVAP